MAEVLVWIPPSFSFALIIMKYKTTINLEVEADNEESAIELMYEKLQEVNIDDVQIE